MEQPNIFRFVNGRLRFRPTVSRAIIAILVAAAGAWAQTEIYEERLGPGDTKLGRFFDTYTVNLDKGERVVIDLISAEFDALLLVEAPDGAQLENDDYEEEGNDSRIDFIAYISGKWRIKATSYEDDEQGAYTLKIMRERIGQVRSHTGVLEEGDTMALKGEYYDTYTIRVQENQRILVDMLSEEFDSYLVVKPPFGPPLVNDDFLSERSSRIEYFAETSGLSQVHVTSFEPAETGAYTLNIVYGEQVDIQTREGMLDSNDEILPEYGYFDEYYLTLSADQHIIVEMISEEVDTFLLVEMPNGSYQENDDYNEQTTISRLEISAAVDGEYRFIAAAYGEEESGSYTIKLYNLAGRHKPVRWVTR